MSNDTTLSFGAVIDTSNFDNGIAHIEGKVSEVGDKTQQETSRISQILQNVPTLNINVVSNASKTLATIDQAYAEIDRVADANKAAINQLEAEYNRLGNLAKAAWNKATVEGNKEYAQLNQQQKSIKLLIDKRKQVLQSVAEEADKVQQLEQRMQKETQAASQSANAQSSFRTQLMQAKNEMRQMVASGQQGTEAYEQVRQKVVELTQAMNVANKQTKVMASPTARFQGVIQGFSGMTSAISVATGAMGLFATENEDLNKIMAKLQSLMTITMGLQSIQQVLNKNSAFQMVTLNGLKEYWNKLLAIGRGEQIAETAATAADTAVQTANTAATVADTTAQTANNAATAAGTVAQGANTAATTIQTGAAVAGTAANIGLAGAFRMVGAAISSIPVFGWIAAGITALIAIISHFVSKSKEMEKQVEEESKIEDDARKAYAQSSAEIQSYQQRINSFNGTKKQEKVLVEELNQKYGTALGRYSSLSQWKDVLRKKGAAYCNMLLKEAEAQAYLNKYTEAFVNLQVVRDKANAGVYDHWYNTKAGDELSRQKEINKAQADVDKWLARYKAKMKEAEDIKINFNFNPIQTTSSPKSSSVGKTEKETDTFDYKKAAQERKEAIEAIKEDIIKWRTDAQSQIDDAVIDSMAEGQAKEINQVELDTTKKKEEWSKNILELAKSIKENYKKMFMAQKGATEEGWQNSEKGKMTDEDYKNALINDPKNYKLYNSQMDDIVEQGERKKQEIRKKYYDQWVEQYGNTQQKIEALEASYQKTLANAPQEFVPQIIKAYEKQFAELRNSSFKESINWDSVFGDLSKQSLVSLQYTLDKVRSYFKKNKDDMGTEDIKNYTEAITKMENEIASRNPFTAFHRSLENIKSSKVEFTKALKEWKEAQQELTKAQEEYNQSLAKKNTLQGQVDLSKTFGQYAKKSVQSLNELIYSLQEKQTNGTISQYEKTLLASMMKMRQQITANNPFQALGDSLGNIKQQLKSFNLDGIKSQINELEAKRIKIGLTIDDEYKLAYLRAELKDAQEQASGVASSLNDKLKSSTDTITSLSDIISQAIDELSSKGGDVSQEAKDNLTDIQIMLGQIQNGVNDNTDNAQDGLKRASDTIKQLGTDIAQLRNQSSYMGNNEAMLDLLQQMQDFLSQDISKSGEQADSYKKSVDDLTFAQNNLTNAQEKENKSENKTLSTRNKITVSYRQFASQIKNIGGVIGNVGQQAKNLASIFDDDVADSIDKAIDTITSLLDAASTVVDALGDTSDKVIDTVSQTAQTTAGAMTATATTASSAIQTVEKASVILAVISAALQVATAIANLFNNDNKKEKEIEHLQQRIDQLQWELDNEDAVRLQERYGDAVKNVCLLYAQAQNEVLSLNKIQLQSGNIMQRIRAYAISQNEIYAKSIQKIADAYANVDYTADKALGADKYNDARKQLENYAEQQILLQKQINAERSKKKTDQSKISDWQQKIQENAEKMASVINDMMEDIIGSSATDLAKELGDAFFEAAAQGENALDAWHDKVKDIVADITKRMMVSKLLEQPIGQIFDKYKKKWFGDDGRFKGIDAVTDSMTGLANDLNEVGDNFKNLYNALPDNIQKMLGGSEADRQGTSKGIATASQESVDENNARLTTIQGHTFTLVQGMDALNKTSNVMLDKLTNIDKNTSQTNEKLERMSSNIKILKGTVDDIYTKGINIKK